MTVGCDFHNKSKFTGNKDKTYCKTPLLNIILFFYQPTDKDKLVT